MSSIQIKVKVKGDEELEDVIEDMVTLAERTQTEVTTKFNGHRLTVRPNDLAHNVQIAFSNGVYLKSNH